MATRWTPSTCGCTIDVDFGADDAAHQLIGVVQKCPKHAAVADNQLLATLLGHNRKGGSVRKWIKDNIAQLGLTKIDEDVIAEIVKLGFDVTAPIGDDPYIIKTQGIGAGKIAAIQNAANSRFGPGVVKVI